MRTALLRLLADTDTDGDGDADADFGSLLHALDEDTDGNLRLAGLVDGAGIADLPVLPVDQVAFFQLRVDPAGTLLDAWQVEADLDTVNPGPLRSTATGGLVMAGWSRGHDELLLTVYAPGGAVLGEDSWSFDGLGYPERIALGPDGNIHVTGTGEAGRRDLDAFAASFSPTPELLWSGRWGETTSDDVAVSLAVDATGHVLVAGETDNGCWQLGDADADVDTDTDADADTTMGCDTIPGLDGNEPQGHRDVFLSRFAPDGTRLWTRQWGSAYMDDTHQVAADPAGNALVLYTTSGTDAMYRGVAKYSPDGTLLWTQESAGGAYRRLAVDSGGNVLVAALAGNDGVLLKLSPEGTELWEQVWTSGSHLPSVEAVLTDASGNVYLAGRPACPWPVQPECSGVFLRKWSADGEELWSQVWGLVLP